MTFFSHFATIRYLKGQGNTTLFVRLRDTTGQYYNFTSGGWDVDESTQTKVFMEEVADSDPRESRYDALPWLPEVNFTTILEYVSDITSIVFGEEIIPARAGVTVGPTGGTALTSVQAVKTYLSLTHAEDDDLLARLVVASSAWFESQTARSFTQASRSDEFVGSGTSRRSLFEQPVTSVTSVWVDGTEVPQAATETDSGWHRVGNLIYLKGYSFTYGALCVVIYNGGYAEIPADVEQAVIETAAMRFRERDRVGEQSKSTAGGNVTFTPYSVPASVQATIVAYRRAA
jgi:hypothetical protein